MAEEYSKFMDFVFLPKEEGRKTYKINVISKKHGFELGRIQWYPQWRQYSFFPHPDTIFNSRCLAELYIFIQELNNARK